MIQTAGNSSNKEQAFFTTKEMLLANHKALLK